MQGCVHRVRFGPAALGLALWACVAAPASAGEITPEAAKLLDALHRTASGIESLTWSAESVSGEVSYTAAYRRGLGLKVSLDYALTEARRDEYFLSPDRHLCVSRSGGAVTSLPDGLSLGMMPFCVPLLDATQLTTFARVEATPPAAGEQSLRLTVASYTNAAMPSLPCPSRR